MTGWKIRSKAQRVRMAKHASRFAVIRRQADADARRRERAVNAPATQPSSPQRRGHRAAKDRLLAAVHDAGTWYLPVPGAFALITERELEYLRAIAAYEHLYWGAVSEISASLGVMNKSGWQMLHYLMQAFGAHNRHQLHAIAKQLIGNGRLRRRSSNRGSMFATVPGEPKGERARTTLQAEALHPGTAPRRSPPPHSPKADSP